MKIGDKVKLIKGNPFGKVGIIKLAVPMARPVNLTNDPMGLENDKLEEYFSCEADDGTSFSGWEDDLELLK